MSYFQHTASCCVFRLLIASLLAALLTGCVGITHYHTKPTVSPVGLGTPQIERSAQHTIDQWMHYQRALSNRSIARNAMPVVLIPLAAVATYRGITTTTQAGRHLVMKLGLGGAAAYGVSTTLFYGPKDAIYAEGMRALACTYGALSPYLQPRATLKQFTDALDELSTDVVRVQQAQQEVRSRASAESEIIPDDPLVKDAEKQSREAGRLIAQARRVQLAAEKTRAQFGSMAAIVDAKLLEIDTAVSAQLSKADPDPAVIMKVIADLPAVAGQISHASTLFGKTDVPGGGAAKTQSNDQPTRADESRERMREAYRALQDAVASMVAHMNFLSQMTQEITARQKEASSFGQCTVQTVASGFSVAPADAEIPLQVGQTQRFVVQSGVARPQLSDLGPHDQKEGAPIKIEEEPDVGRITFKVTYVKKIAGIDHAQLLFSDGAARSPSSKTVTLLLGEAPAKAEPEKPAPKPPANNAKPVAKPIAAAPPDRKPAGSGTPEKPPSETPPKGGVAPQPPVITSKPPVNTTQPSGAATPPCVINQPCSAYERGLKKDEIVAIQKRLGLGDAASGVFDDATRRAIGRTLAPQGHNTRVLDEQLVKLLPQ